MLGSSVDEESAKRREHRWQSRRRVAGMGYSGLEVGSQAEGVGASGCGLLGICAR